MRRFHNPALASLAMLAAACGATMAAARTAPDPALAQDPKVKPDANLAPQEPTVKEKAADEENPPRRDQPKQGVQGPESGPTGHTVVDATSPAPTLGAGAPAADPEVTKLRVAAEKAAANLDEPRTVRVRAKTRGYIGLKIREEGDVFVLQLDKGEPLPKWVVIEPDENVATTPVTHSSEAQSEVVGEDGIGKKLDSNDVL